MIPYDIRRFGFAQLFGMILSIAAACAVIQINQDWGYAAVGIVVTFWCGMAILWCSDMLAPGVPIDQRRLGSQLLNLIGVILVAGATTLGLGWIGVSFLFLCGLVMQNLA